jgi:hypothetical protein
MDAWRSDVKLIWDNCRKYNGADHAVTKLADKLNTALDRRMDEAYALARQNLAALDAGEARPRKGCEGGEGDPFGSDSDSGDALLGGGAARAVRETRDGACGCAAVCSGVCGCLVAAGVWPAACLS